ncbi:MAG: hypothetical protein WC045_04165 [Patescibacteria group bacterium]
MSLIDFSKIKMFQKKPKTFQDRLRNIPMPLKAVTGVLVLAIVATSVTSALQLRTKAATQTPVFSKLIGYQYDKNKWVDYASDSNGIDAFAVNGSGYLMYRTGDGRLFGRTSANTSNPGPATQVVNYPGSISEIVDISSGFGYTYVLEKNGKVFRTANNTTSWETRAPVPVAIMNNNAMSIGNEGIAAEIVVSTDGKVAISNGATWTDLTSLYNQALYGKANSGDVAFSRVFISTDKGYLLYSPGNTNFVPYFKFSVGGYIYPSVWDLGNSGGIALAYPIDAERRNNVFVQYVGTAGGSGVGDNNYLRASIPGCQMGKMAQYTFSGQIGFLANISDQCDPNTPTPPPTGGGDVITNNVTNNYSFDPKGVSIHSKVAGPDGTATVKKGEAATFTLTVNNPDPAAKNVTVRFLVPKGFAFSGVVAPTPAVSSQAQTADGLQLTWDNYPAQPGSNNFLVINTTAPTQ